MLTQHVSLSLRLGNSQSNARRYQLAFCEVKLAVHALLQALLGDELCIVGRALSFAERFQFPGELIELRVGQRGIQNDGVALVLHVQGSRFPVDLRSLKELPEWGVEKRLDGIEVRHRWRRAFQGKRKSIGVAEAGTYGELRNVVCPHFLVGLAGSPLVDCSDAHDTAVQQRQVHRSRERNRFRSSGGIGCRARNTRKDKCAGESDYPHSATNPSHSVTAGPWGHSSSTW